MSLQIADMICRKVQIEVFAKMGKQPDEINSFTAPRKERTVYPDGIVRVNDLCYGEEFPNSFLDLWQAEPADSSHPTVVYFHGGGMLFGDKATGDPLAAEGAIGMMREIVKHGFNLVSVNYALAPDYRFPVQPQQGMQALLWLTRNAESLHLNMDQVIIMGSSAGANMTLLLAQAAANPAYASLLEIKEVIDRERIKALVLDESALSVGGINQNLDLMGASWLGEDDFVSGKKAKLVVAQNYMENTFFPTFVNSSNVEDFFHMEAMYTVSVLKKNGVPYEYFYRTQDEAGALPHGFLEQFATNAASKECLDRILAFMRQFIAESP